MQNFRLPVQVLYSLQYRNTEVLPITVRKRSIGVGVQYQVELRQPTVHVLVYVHHRRYLLPR